MAARRRSRADEAHSRSMVGMPFLRVRQVDQLRSFAVEDRLKQANAFADMLAGSPVGQAEELDGLDAKDFRGFPGLSFADLPGFFRSQMF